MYIIFKLFLIYNLKKICSLIILKIDVTITRVLLMYVLYIVSVSIFEKRNIHLHAISFTIYGNLSFAI